MPAKQMGTTRILVSTRPAKLAEPLLAALKATGAQVLSLPTLTTSAITDSPVMQQAITQLNTYHYQIFISRPAVAAAMPQILAYWSVLDLTQLCWAGVGQGTQSALAAYDLPVVAAPDMGHGGQALLDTLKSKLRKGEQALIWRGDSGRDELAQGLRDLGLHVAQVACYQRQATQADTRAVANLLAQGKPMLFIVTSALGLDNLVTLLTPQADALKQCALLVVSPRLAAYARELGFSSEILISPSMDEQAIVQTLAEH